MQKDIYTYSTWLVSCFIPKQSFVYFHVQDAAIESLTTVRPYSNEIHAQAQLWLKKDPKASYEAWKKCLPARGKSWKRTKWFYTRCFQPFTIVCISTTAGQEVVSKPQGKAELRRQYLLEKYVWKWKQFMRSRKGEGLFPRLLKLSHNNWLRQVHSFKHVLQAWSPPLVFSSSF